MFDDYLKFMPVLQAIGSLGLLAVAIVTSTIALRQFKNASNQLRISGTSDLFERFNRPDFRDMRRWVYSNTRQLINAESVSKWAKNDEHLKILETVCNSLELTAYLVKSNLVNKNDAIELYGDSIIRSWIILQKWVVHRRKTNGAEKFLWPNFKWLADEAISSSFFDAWRKEGVLVYTETELLTINYKTSEIVGTTPLPGKKIGKRQ